DLLLAAPAAIAEILVEGRELDLVPADADAEPEPSAREYVERGRLLRHQRRLPLRQDQDLGREMDLARDAREEREQHEAVVEIIRRRSGVAPGGPARRVDAEHGVGGRAIIEPDPLRGLPELAHHLRRTAGVDQGQHVAEPHRWGLLSLTHEESLTHLPSDRHG